jgi:hypothetical protein
MAPEAGGNMLKRLSALILSIMLMTHAFASELEYDTTAKTQPNPNDIKALVYHWFAGLDHQVDLEYFTPYLPTANLDLHFYNTDIQTRPDLDSWYATVQHTMAWNAHEINQITVTGTAENGWTVLIAMHHMLLQHDGKHMSIHCHQSWTVHMTEEKALQITAIHTTVDKITQG